MKLKLILLVLMILIVIPVSFSLTSTEITTLTNSIIWSNDYEINTTNDKTNNNQGTQVGSIGNVSINSTGCLLGSCALFTLGDTSHIIYSSISEYESIYNQTLSCWIRKTDTDTFASILSRLAVDGSQGTWRILESSLSTDEVISQSRQDGGNTSIIPYTFTNTWVMLTSIWNTTGERIYTCLNDSNDCGNTGYCLDAPCVVAPMNSSDDLWIGNQEGAGGSDDYAGYLDECEWYNRSLTAKEIKYKYDENTAGRHIGVSLIVTANLNTSVALPDDNIAVSGHLELNNGSIVINNPIGIYLDEVPFTVSGVTNYDFQDTTNNDAYTGLDFQNMSPAHVNRSEWNVSGTELNTQNYTNLGASDDAYVISHAETNRFQQLVHDFVILINDTVTDISQVNISWEGHAVQGAELEADNNITMFLYNTSSNLFVLVNSKHGGVCNATDCFMNYSINSDFTDFINSSGHLRFIVQKYEKQSDCNSGCLVNGTDGCENSANTAWGAGTFSCPAGSGNDSQRCYEGTCSTCSTDDGQMWGFTCSPGTCTAVDNIKRVSDSRVCWRLGVNNSGDSCDDVCANYGTALSTNWDDDNSCTACSNLLGGDETGGCGIGGGDTSPLYNSANDKCVSRDSSTAISLGTATATWAQRLCICQSSLYTDYINVKVTGEPQEQTDSQGNYNVTFAASASEGIHTIKINSTFMSVTGETETTFIVDNIPPSITDCQINNSHLECNDWVRFSCNVTDANSIDNVSFGIDDSDGKIINYAELLTGDLWNFDKQYTTSSSNNETFNFTNSTAVDSVGNLNVTDVSLPYYYNCDLSPPVITLVSPVNNTVNGTYPLNISITVTDDSAFDMTCILRNTTVIFDERTFAQGTNNLTLYDGLNTLIEQDFPNLNITCYDNSITNNSALMMLNYTIDSITPDITLISPLNRTRFNTDIHSSININSECFDWNVFRFNITISNSSDTVQSYESLIVLNNIITIDENLDITSLGLGNYTVLHLCYDSHTSRKITDYNILKVSQEKSIGWKNIDDEEITIKYLNDDILKDFGTYKAETDDKYIFYYNMNNTKNKGIKTYNFEILSDYKVYYLPDSKYKAHFVTGKYWIDFNLGDSKAAYNVYINGNGNYEVEIKTVLNNLVFESIGELNEAVLEAQFELFFIEQIENYFSVVECKNDTGSVILLGTFTVIALILILIGFIMRLGFVGFFGALLLMILTWYISPCIQIYAYALALFSALMMIYFVVTYLGFRNETYD